MTPYRVGRSTICMGGPGCWLLAGLLLLAGCDDDGNAGAADSAGGDTGGGDAGDSGTAGDGGDAAGDAGGDAVPEGLISAAAGGVVTLPDGLGTLTIPAGSLAADTMITVTVGANEFQGGVGPALDFGPDGTTFDPPAILNFTYDASEWDEALEERGLAPAVAVEGDDALALQPITSTPTLGNSEVLVSHFSRFVVVPAPSINWFPDFEFPASCFQLWQETACGGSPPAAEDADMTRSCPQIRNWVSTEWPPTDTISDAAVVEWPETTSNTMTVVPANATEGALFPAGMVRVHWAISALLTTPAATPPDWCDADQVGTIITESIDRAGGETARVLYTNPVLTCNAPPYYRPNGTQDYPVCVCEVEFDAFPWPDEDIPYTVDGSQLTIFNESRDFCVAEGQDYWWLDVPVVANVDILGELPDTSEYLFTQMKLVVER